MAQTARYAAIRLLRSFISFPPMKMPRRAGLTPSVSAPLRNAELPGDSAAAVKARQGPAWHPSKAARHSACVDRANPRLRLPVGDAACGKTKWKNRPAEYQKPRRYRKLRKPPRAAPVHQSANAAADSKRTAPKAQKWRSG